MQGLFNNWNPFEGLGKTIATCAVALLAIGAVVGSLVGHAVGQGAPNATGFTGNPLTQQGQHYIAGGNPPALGLAAQCGTGATVFGSDLAGVYTVGTTPGPLCPITFAQPYVNAPSCIVANGSSTTAIVFAATPTILNITNPPAGNVISWICFGRAGG